MTHPDDRTLCSPRLAWKCPKTEAPASISMRTDGLLSVINRVHPWFSGLVRLTKIWLCYPSQTVVCDAWLKLIDFRP